MANFTALKTVWENEMIILGHKLISYEPFYFVKDIEGIKGVKKGGAVAFYFNEEMIEFCQNQKITFAICITSDIEAIISNGAGAQILICPTNLALRVQELAEYYLFDSKVAVVAEDLGEALQLKVDMAILPNAIIYE